MVTGSDHSQRTGDFIPLIIIALYLANNDMLT